MVDLHKARLSNQTISRRVGWGSRNYLCRGPKLPDKPNVAQELELHARCWLMEGGWLWEKSGSCLKLHSGSLFMIWRQLGPQSTGTQLVKPATSWTEICVSKVSLLKKAHVQAFSLPLNIYMAQTRLERKWDIELFSLNLTLDPACSEDWKEHYPLQDSKRWNTIFEAVLPHLL